MPVIEVTPDSPLFPGFLDLPWRIYPGRFPWVPPLKAAIASELSLSNPFFRHGQAKIFVFTENDVVVGRIVASVDQALADDKLAHFGYFETIDSPEVAKGLLQAAEGFARQQGKVELHGPMDLSIFARYRVLTKGFDLPAFYGEPRSPRYYLDLLAASGFKLHAEWRSWDIPGKLLPVMAQGLAAKAAQFQGVDDRYRFESFDLEHFDQECARLFPVALETWSGNYGYSTAGLEEFAHYYLDARHVMATEASYKGLTKDGELMGFSYVYRDPAPAFIAADGDGSKLDLGSVSSGPQTLVFHTIGLLPSHRKGGLIEVGGARALERIVKQGYRHAIGALAKAGPTVYDPLGEATRSYGVFAKTLS